MVTTSEMTLSSDIIISVPGLGKQLTSDTFIHGRTDVQKMSDTVVLGRTSVDTVSDATVLLPNLGYAEIKAAFSKTEVIEAEWTKTEYLAALFTVTTEEKP